MQCLDPPHHALPFSAILDAIVVVIFHQEPSRAGLCGPLLSFNVNVEIDDVTTLRLQGGLNFVCGGPFA